MARGSRTYNRDNRGRFASKGSGPTKAKPATRSKRSSKPTVTGGSLPARAKVRAAAAKLAERPSPQQKGAVTRARKGLTVARTPVRMKASSAPRLRKRPGASRPAPPTGKGAANGIRSSRPRASARSLAASNIRPVTLGTTGRELRGDRARSQAAIKAHIRRLMRVQRNYSLAQAQKPAKGAAGRRAARSEQVARAAFAEYRRPRTVIKPFRPTTINGRIKQIERQMDRTMKDAVDAVRNLGQAVRKARPELDQISRQIERMNADAIAKRLSPNKYDRMVAGVELGTIGGRSGAKAIQRRMERAAAAAAQGSRAGARARVIYANQLAFMGPGKPAKGQNNYRPGPSNKQQPPKKKRRGGKRKPKG